MGLPRFQSIQSILTAIAIVGAMSLTIVSPAAGTPWQKSRANYDSSRQWHDAGWWLQNRHDWGTLHHPKRTENYAGKFGRVGDSHLFPVWPMWPYGDGGFDPLSNAVAVNGAKNTDTKDTRDVINRPTRSSEGSTFFGYYMIALPKIGTSVENKASD